MSTNEYTWSVETTPLSAQVVSKYDIIERSDHKRLINAVNQKIKEGWSLQGGVSTSASNIGNNSSRFHETYIFAQAMVLYEEIDSDDPI